MAALQVLLDILLLTWGVSEDYEIVVKILNSRNSIWIFPIWIFPCVFLFFLEAVIFTALFRRCLTLFMWMLKYATLFQRLFGVVPSRDIASTKRQRWNNVEMFSGLTPISNCIPPRNILDKFTIIRDLCRFLQLSLISSTTFDEKLGFPIPLPTIKEYINLLRT